MPASEPRVFINHTPQPFRRLVIGALPQCGEGAGGRNDRVVMHPIIPRDFRKLIGHARTAGDAMDQATRAFQHAAGNPFSAAHLPQNIGMDAALAAGHIPGALGLGDAALDAVFNQFFMPVATGSAVIDLPDDAAIRVIAIGIDGRESANAARRCPGTAGAPI